jgi:hypothetical protein
MATMKKAQNGDKTKSKTTLDKISSTKLKDVPQKVKNLGKKAVDKVKNTTVGDAAETILDIATSGSVTAGKTLQTGFNKLVGRKRTGGPVKKKMKNGGSIGSKVVKENPRQQKRLSRIKKNNPERAERVEKRMVKRADRAMGARGAVSRMKSGGSVKKK